MEGFVVFILFFFFCLSCVFIGVIVSIKKNMQAKAQQGQKRTAPRHETYHDMTDDLSFLFEDEQPAAVKNTPAEGVPTVKDLHKGSRKNRPQTKTTAEENTQNAAEKIADLLNDDIQSVVVASEILQRKY